MSFGVVRHLMSSVGTIYCCQTNLFMHVYHACVHYTPISEYCGATLRIHAWFMNRLLTVQNNHGATEVPVVPHSTAAQHQLYNVQQPLFKLQAFSLVAATGQCCVRMYRTNRPKLAGTVH